MVVAARPVVVAVAITGSVPRKKDNPGGADDALGADRVDASRPSGGGDPRAYSCAQSRREPVLRPRFVRSGPGGAAQALPGHDRAIFDRRARPRPGCARLVAAAEARHGLAVDRLGQFSDHRLRERDRPGRGSRRQDARARHPAGNRDFRSLAYPRRAPAHRRGADARRAPRAIRDGRQKRDAGAGASARHFARTRRAACCRRRPGPRRASASTRAA